MKQRLKTEVHLPFFLYSQIGFIFAKLSENPAGQTAYVPSVQAQQRFKMLLFIIINTFTDCELQTLITVILLRFLLQPLPGILPLGNKTH
jgi:hypothetical protein